MKLSIEVKNRAEREALARAMADPTCRALVMVIGYLKTLPSDRARRLVLRHVAEVLEEAELTTSRPWAGPSPVR